MKKLKKKNSKIFRTSYEILDSYCDSFAKF